jgi:drug/metabolite transporter (DMT)-like permease
MGIVLCLVAIAFFSIMYLLLGQSQKRGAEPMGINLVAFVAGTLISLASAVPVSAAQFPPRLIIIGSLIGITAGFGLLATTIAVRAGIPVSIVNGGVSLCLIVPVLLSSVLYHEIPGPRKWLGIAMAGVAILLIQREQR